VQDLLAVSGFVPAAPEARRASDVSRRQILRRFVHGTAGTVASATVPAPGRNCLGLGYLLLVERCGEATLKAYPGAPFSMRGARVVILSLSGNSTPNALVSLPAP